MTLLGEGTARIKLKAQSLKQKATASRTTRSIIVELISKVAGHRARYLHEDFSIVLLLHLKTDIISGFIVRPDAS
jgi:hypothetical protein